DAASLELAEPDLDRIGIVILGDAEQQEIFGAIPIRLAELPERAADRVKPRGRHVDRADSAMRGVVRRTELLRPISGERLTLVPAGEERELLGIGGPDLAEPLAGDAQRLGPFDLPEFRPTSLTDAQQRFREPRRRVLLHDSGGALGANHAAVHRMRAVALDVANAAVLEMHANAAAARAHVAGRRFYLVRAGLCVTLRARLQSVGAVSRSARSAKSRGEPPC